MKANFKSIIVLVLIVGIVIVAGSFLLNRQKDDEFVYSDLLELFEEDLVRDFVIDNNAVMTLNAYKATKNPDGGYDFELDENGLYYNKRLDEEISKRAKYSESRRNNIEKRYKNKLRFTKCQSACLSSFVSLAFSILEKNKYEEMIKKVGTAILMIGDMTVLSTPE